MLDITAFRNALTQLETMERFRQKALAEKNAETIAVGRTAAVKGFEYSYGLSIKFMQRTVNILGAEDDTSRSIPFRDLLRSALDYGLISSIDTWLAYREKRNETSHAYAENKAEAIVTIIPAFLKEAQQLLKAIEAKAKDKS